MATEQPKGQDYEEKKTIGGFSVYSAIDPFKTSIALILNGDMQKHGEIALHSCTLESGDHVHSFSSIGSIKKQNQDRLVVYPDHSFVFLADGYGSYGDLIANSIALYCLEHPTKSLRNIATESQRKLNEVAPDLERKTDNAGKEKQKGGIGCGFIRIEKNEMETKKILNYLRIGDVNIAVLRGGKVVLRTIDQTLEQKKLKEGVSTEVAKNSANVLVNAISADNDDLECDEPQNFELEKGDRVLIGCDGVMKERSDQELEEAISKKNPKEMTWWLCEKGYAGYDNITAAVIDIT